MNFLKSSFFFFFFNDTATTEIYTLSLHDALPICGPPWLSPRRDELVSHGRLPGRMQPGRAARSEEHTSELQSHLNLVCRLLLEKKKKKITLSGRQFVDVPVEVTRNIHYPACSILY